MANSKSAAGIGALLLFGLFWNGIVGAFDVVILRQKMAEWNARAHFSEVPATVLRSDVASSRSSDGTSYRPSIEFEYFVGGRRYVSDRYAYTVWGSSDRSAAEHAVDAYPVGGATTARVDPEDPAEAVLDVSGAAFPAFIVLFLTPFHCVGIGILVACVSAVRRRRWSDVDRRRHEFIVVDDASHFVLRRPAPSAAAVFLSVLGVTSFLTIFPLAMTLGFGTSAGVALSAWGALVTLAIAASICSRVRARRPENFLHVDRQRGLFSFPADAPGERLDRIEALEVRSAETGMTVNDVPHLRHVFEVVVDGKHREAFRHRGPADDARFVTHALEQALGLSPSTGLLRSPLGRAG